MHACRHDEAHRHFWRRRRSSGCVRGPHRPGPRPAAGGQRPDELAGAPRLFSGQEYDRDRDRDWNNDRDNNDRRNQPNFQNAQRNCSRAGIQEAWNRNYYSAQYDGGPRLEYGRRGWELRGRMRLHNNRGYSYVNTVCDLRRGGDVSAFEFLR